MFLRRTVKKLLHRYVPGVRGSYRYYGTRVFFPPSAYIWDVLCEEGIYESRLLSFILAAVRPGTWYFDAGTNIGLMSVPVLQSAEGVHVLSFEPSANSRNYLQRTWEHSAYRDRWTLRHKAVGDHSGAVQFNLSVPTHGGFDGIQNTQRVPSFGVETVELTTLDAEWQELGCPPVSCIKLDVEGAELDALRGARKLIAQCTPHIFLEWYEKNFDHFGCKAEDLLTLAGEYGYELVAADGLSVIESPAVLALQMRTTASYILVPRVRCGVSAERMLH